MANIKQIKKQRIIKINGVKIRVTLVKEVCSWYATPKHRLRAFAKILCKH